MSNMIRLWHSLELTVPRHRRVPPRRLWKICGLAAALLAGSALLAPVRAVDLGSIPPVSAALARVWFYRAVDPYDSPRVSLVRLNGAIAGTPYQGSAFYRDVPSGSYQISVDSQSAGPNPSVSVTLQPGQVIYVDVAMSQYMDQEFAIALVPPDMGQQEVAESSFGGGGALGM